MTNQVQQETTAPELTVIDLQNIRAVFDVAAKRGAFSAGEMAAVGSVYNKLDAFLNSVAPAPSSEAQPQNSSAEQTGQ